MMIIFAVKENYFVKRIKEEAERNKIELNICNPLETSIYPDGIFFEGKPVPESDLVYFRGSVDTNKRERISALSDYYENRGIRVINKATSSYTSSNKWKSRQILAANGIRMPRACIAVNKDELDRVVEALGGFPIIVKLFYGCHGSGVVFISDKFTLLSVFDALRVVNKSFFFEEYIADAQNGVLRFLCAGDRILANLTMLPMKGDFRSNYANGGMGRPNCQNSSIAAVAVQCVKLCGLDFGAVDIVKKSDGSFCVLEINSSPGIEHAESATGENIAGELLRSFLSLRDIV